MWFLLFLLSLEFYFASAPSTLHSPDDACDRNTASSAPFFRCTALTTLLPLSVVIATGPAGLSLQLVRASCRASALCSQCGLGGKRSWFGGTFHVAVFHEMYCRHSHVAPAGHFCEPGGETVSDLSVHSVGNWYLGSVVSSSCITLLQQGAVSC